jgi:glycosyltransferase involved in cell wall biosynthesis
VPQVTRPTVTVLIPTRGRARLLERSLDTVLADPATTEVIVVLDGPDPDTVALVERLIQEDARLRLERVERDPERLERGGQAREKGVLLATSEVILALDDDVVPRPGLVSGHATRHAAEDDVVVLGAMPVVTAASSGDDVTARIYGGSYNRACRRYENDADAILEGLWGGNLSIRRRDWLKAVEQPRAAAGYHADLELGLLLKRAGLRGVFDPQLRADHVYRRSRRDFVRDAQSSGAGRVRLLLQHPELEARGHIPPRPALRALLWIGTAKGGWPFLRESLLAVACAARALRVPLVERNALLVLWRLGVDRGMRLVASSTPANPSARASPFR